MRNWLNKPFPFIETSKQKLTISFLFAVFIYLFLLIFQPFGIAENKSIPIYLLGFSAITLVVMLFSFFVFPVIFKKAFDPEKWTTKKEILFALLIITLISVFNWLYNSTISYTSVRHSFISFLFITIAVGIFPTVLLIMYFEKHFTTKHEIIASELTEQISVKDEKKEIETSIKENKNQQIKIVSYNEKEVIELELNDFLCISAEGNYANVFFYENNTIKKKLIRNSLTKINDQLIIFDDVKRCYRSYIVNIQNVSRVSGNARNYYLHVDNLDFKIPVSRNFPKEILENLKN